MIQDEDPALILDALQEIDECGGLIDVNQYQTIREKQVMEAAVALDYVVASYRLTPKGKKHLKGKL